MKIVYTLLFIASFTFVSILESQDPFKQNRDFFNQNMAFWDNMRNQQFHEQDQARDKFLAECNMRNCIFMNVLIDNITMGKLDPNDAINAAIHNGKVLAAMNNKQQ